MWGSLRVGFAALGILPRVVDFAHMTGHAAPNMSCGSSRETHAIAALCVTRAISSSGLGASRRGDKPAR